MRPSVFGLAENPARFADRRAEPQQATLAFYSPEQVEALARSLAAGTHREPSPREVSAEELAARAGEDAQDSELVRVAAYAGLRRGETVALRWRDVDFAGRKLIVRRAVSGDVEVSSTKSRRARQVPMPTKRRPRLNHNPARRVHLSDDYGVLANRPDAGSTAPRCVGGSSGRAARPAWSAAFP